MRAAEFAAEARILWRLLRGQPRTGSHADRLQAFYAPQAERYDAFRARLLHGREQLIEELALRPGERVVELGCGTGSSLRFIGPLAASLERFDMVDLCPALLAIAARRAQDWAPARIHQADAASWRPEAPADAVFMSYSLTMMPQWPAVLANAQAMLAPGGRFGIVDFHLPGSGLADALWRRWFAHDGVHLSAHHLPALRQLFREHRQHAGRAPLPYLPWLRAPYYRFVGFRERNDVP